MSKRLPEMNGGKIQHGKIGAIPVQKREHRGIHFPNGQASQS